ncbi:hypothetical protein [Pseudomonas sp. C2B4]|uniref:hypothetical protein n=1 Tax=Pseudomonas sp. C2B4 TaxID=2735270 RepID=UPI0015869158|nr:hypothetical protein [Pseudomonas sp. C2B4]NUU34238.1 hypothetical protein [Pseudomonas sp. C2B4]
MTNRNGHSASTAMLDNDAFIKAASVGDTVLVGSTTHTVIKKRFTESNDTITRYFVEIDLNPGLNYKTSQSISANEYLALLTPGNLVRIGPANYVVENTEFVKDDNGAQIRRVNWHPEE